MDEALIKIGGESFRGEIECLLQLKKFLGDFSPIYSRAKEKAEKLINKARGKPPELFEALLQNYPLNSAEGRALMVLCEALPRIPDSATKQELLNSVINSADWNSGGNALGKASDLALWLVSRLTSLRISNIVSPIFQKTATGIIEKLSGGFILAETIDAGIKKAAVYEEKKFMVSYDMLGESARNKKQAEQYFNSYLNAIRKVGEQHSASEDWKIKPSVSVKLSALYHRYELLKEKEVMEHLLPRLLALLQEAAKYNILLTIDAEDASRFDLYLEIFGQAFADESFGEYDGFGLALQAYQKRAFHALDYLAELSRAHKRIIPIRLVKGAYWDSEIKIAQVGGFKDYPVFTAKENTDVSYIACAKKILSHPKNFYPQFATHNVLSIAIVSELAGENKFELQKLHGMGDAIYESLVEKIPCRIYAPIGSFNELLPYLIRRLLENGANNSFVNKMAEKDIGIDEILENPLEYEKENYLPLPENIYRDRKNSKGFDLGNIWELEKIKNELEKFNNNYWRAFSLVDDAEKTGISRIIHEPANINRNIGDWSSAENADVAEALEAAEKGFAKWRKTSVEERAQALEKLAELLEKNRFELIALCVHEAGKTLPDAIAEIREAVDYCRYYAAEARRILNVPHVLESPAGEYNDIRLFPRGIFVAISPWNFPLAIFIGQIAAAIVTGNSVIAKPAEQTPLISHFTIRLMHKAGIPVDVIQLLLGTGEKIGAALVRHSEIAGVVFTGGTETARAINLILAAKNGPIVPLIAETGGQNAMIVDSSALLEQTADDIVRSAFGSSGQRCSSLRVLYIQEEIAEKLIELLCGMLADFNIKSPANLDCDMGPVIDAEAKDALLSHIGKMRKKAVTLFDGEKIPIPENGYFVPPFIFQINSIKDLEKEVFGPILHIVRFKSNELDDVIADINSTNFGLTLGIQTRISTRAEYIASNVNVGNCYVNRTQIGAVVGVQPFGGEKLSGTGFKAGGPHYLLRFLTERTYTVNTSAIGGDVSLLSGA